ncbi:MAG: carbon-nitrogen family hydrolase [Syntrophobacteraceae bacterium]|jgi:predicted amidohydrolase|nr:carbon-nitrogen family hydrolase [Syntrophobacteraceae bacterium]
MSAFTAACWQLEVTTMGPEKQLHRLERALDQLSQKACRLLVLPEMWLCGFSFPELGTLALRTPYAIAQWQEWCRRTSMVLVGSMPEVEGGNLFNTSYVVDANGELAGRYRKSHLFSPNGEHLRFAAGRDLLVCNTRVGRLGILICYDLRFPEVCRRLTLDGAQVLCVSALWPSVRIHHWDLLLRARALENQVFVLGCNGCGADGDLHYGGSSAIVRPTGECLGSASENEECIVAVIDLREVESFRRAIPCWNDRREDLYGNLGG